MIASATRLFPVWALALAGVAYLWPAPFAALRPAIVWLLALVMFGMGMSLTPANFAEILRRPFPIGLGLGLQYLVMPLAAWAISAALHLSPQLTAGMILVGTAPGGTASNVICYLARGDVALSITLTAASTLLAVVATPYLTLLYVGQAIDVPATRMLADVFQIVFVPVTAGTLLNWLFHRRVHSIKRVFPLVSVAAIVLIIAIVVALNQRGFAQLGALLAGAVVLHNLLGLVLGYAIPAALGLDRRICRTLAIEVGMQNSGLAVALATQYFSPLAALPGALFSIWHNLSGSTVAAWWSRRPA